MVLWESQALSATQVMLSQVWDWRTSQRTGMYSEEELHNMVFIVHYERVTVCFMIIIRR